MKVHVYGLQKCSTCIKATDWLRSKRIDFNFTDYRENPISPTLLKSWAKQLTWEKLVNRASYTWRDLPEEKKSPQSDDQWLELIKEFPALIKRPVVVQDEQVSVGFSEKKFTETFDC